MPNGGTVEERLGRIEVKQADTIDSLSRLETGLEKMVDFIRREIEQKEMLLKSYIDLKALEGTSQTSGLRSDLARLDMTMAAFGTRLGLVEGWRNRMRGGLMVACAIGSGAGGLVVFILTKVIH